MDDLRHRAQRPAAADGEAVARLGAQRPGVEIDAGRGGAGKGAEGDGAGNLGLAGGIGAAEAEGEAGAAGAVAGIGAEMPASGLAPRSAIAKLGIAVVIAAAEADRPVVAGAGIVDAELAARSRHGCSAAPLPSASVRPSWPEAPAHRPQPSPERAWLRAMKREARPAPRRSSEATSTG